jgi:hypothetical protein
MAPTHHVPSGFLDAAFRILYTSHAVSNGCAGCGQYTGRLCPPDMVFTGRSQGAVRFGDTVVIPEFIMSTLPPGGIEAVSTHRPNFVNSSMAGVGALDRN